MNNCLLCGDTFVPTTEAHMIENLCYPCLFDPNRIEELDCDM
jgi:hypothetical protein